VKLKVSNETSQTKMIMAKLLHINTVIVVLIIVLFIVYFVREKFDK